MHPDLIVQKYGGATLSDPNKIRNVAQRVVNLSKQGKKIVMVVSAMGQTTNSLINLAHEVSPHPSRRELDMLLSTGERISMALMSMALNDLGASAISFTGSQAGILTDDSHQNAFIKDVTPYRLVDALKQNKIVVLAGFQGVSPVTKEITTLGRGGSDTTAVAIAAALGASHCEILKDVSSIFTADPNLVKDAKPIHKLNYKHLMDMTFWGAKVLHYRSVELAKTKSVKLYIGPAHSQAEGTWVQDEGDFMFESNQILSLNSFEEVLQLTTHAASLHDGLALLQNAFTKNEIAFPQILHMEDLGGNQSFYIAGPKEIIAAIELEFRNDSKIHIGKEHYATVSATCTGSTTPELTQLILKKLEKTSVTPAKCFQSSMTTSFLVKKSERNKSLEQLHKLILQDSLRF